jgi:hypothetical protein
MCVVVVAVNEVHVIPSSLTISQLIQTLEQEGTYRARLSHKLTLVLEEETGAKSRLFCKLFSF